MPFRHTPPYGMICFDADGDERRDDPDGPMGDRLEALAASDDFTNIFLFAHGWNGGVPEAYDQFDRWIAALESHTADRSRAAEVFPGFKPLYIGIHWPSLAHGDESLGGQPPSAEFYVRQFGDTPAIATAVNALDHYERHDAWADEPTPDAVAAGESLVRELGLSDLDMDGNLFAEGGPELSYGSGLGGVLLGPLRTLSYWTMKKRARSIGETGGHDFLKRLQLATAASRKPIHLMGHSFGTIVISSILGGPNAQGALHRPVDSVALLQGAVSLWSYAETIPKDGGPGYFHPVAVDGKVRGPLIASRSKHDSAVNLPYKAASAVSGAQSFAPGAAADDDSDYHQLDSPPKYGAIGRFGIRGLSVTDLPMNAKNEPYPFECGRIYNLESSQYICKDQGIGTGAHNDIDGPEVAHAIWEAAFASAR